MGARSSRTTAAATYTIPSGDGLESIENKQNNLCCDANKALTEDYKTLQGILASTKKSLEENLAATKKSLEECSKKEQFVQAQLEPNTESLTYAGGGKRRRRRTAKKRLSRRRKSHRRL
jgi:hypothetical protein